MNVCAPNSETVVGIAERLREEEHKLNQQHTALKTQLGQADRELRRIRGALRALGEPAGQPTTGRRSTALTTRDVIQFIDDILEGGGPAACDTLREQVEAGARAASRSLIGFHLRFKKRIHDERFLVVGLGGDAVVSRRQPGIGRPEK